MRPKVEEVLRYAGLPCDVMREEAQAVIDQLCRTADVRWIWKVTERAFPGKLAQRFLQNAETTVILCCTLGAAFDRQLRAMESRDMAQAVLWNAAGSALVECGLDEAEREIQNRFPDFRLSRRFSPGYGDLPLMLQRELCRELDTERRLGVYVTDSLLLNPVKSVTAIVGLCKGGN